MTQLATIIRFEYIRMEKEMCGGFKLSRLLHTTGWAPACVFRSQISVKTAAARVVGACSVITSSGVLRLLFDAPPCSRLLCSAKSRSDTPQQQQQQQQYFSSLGTGEAIVLNQRPLRKKKMGCCMHLRLVAICGTNKPIKAVSRIVRFFGGAGKRSPIGTWRYK